MLYFLLFTIFYLYKNNLYAAGKQTFAVLKGSP